MATSSNPLPPNLTLHRYKRTNKSYVEDLGGGVKLTLMLMPAGEFMMGAPEDEPDSDDDERPQHLVQVPQFLMGRYPVTQEQWLAVMGEFKREPEFRGAKRPIENVSWQDAQEFCRTISEKAGKDYRLPSEAQWEYACRAGMETPFHFGDRLTEELANYSGNKRETTDVGIFPANDWGLHEMHGNVWEWCEDDWHENYEGAPTDGSAWIDNDNRSQSYKLLRGGSWFNNPWYCRSAIRRRHSPVNSLSHVGFRVCCVRRGLFLST
jgi:formylglycine-generating enzyme required for sulfatase activity